MADMRGINGWSRRSAASALLLVLSLLLFSQAGWIHAKATLAQYLIADAWQRTLLHPGSTHKPWRWADTWPVLRLQWPAGDEDLYVLAGSTGNALAFGPGQAFGTAAIGTGASVVAGHRDTHFSFLQHLRSDDVLRIQDRGGHWYAYQVSSIAISDATAGPLLLDSTVDTLTLVTCYPFDAIDPGGPLRYVVTALRYDL